jgi:hypothetical protein
MALFLSSLSLRQGFFYQTAFAGQPGQDTRFALHNLFFCTDDYKIYSALLRRRFDGEARGSFCHTFLDFVHPGQRLRAWDEPGLPT